MTAPGVESESETLVVALKVPGVGLKIDVAAVGHPPAAHPELGLELTSPPSPPQEDKGTSMNSWMMRRKSSLIP
jgi:hypothetical protein